MTTKDKIFYYMDKNGISQKDFARLLGVTSGTVSDWKKERSKSYMSYLSLISRVLNVPVSLLIDDSNDFLASVRSRPHASIDHQSLLANKPTNSFDEALTRYKQSVENNLLNDLDDRIDEEERLILKYRQLKAKYPDRKIILRAVEPDSYEIL